MSEVEKILNPNEKVIWQGRPEFLPYILSLFGYVISGILLALLAYALIVLPDPNDLLPNEKLLALSVIGGFALLLMIVVPLIKILALSYIQYVVTDKRAIFQSGIIGRDFDFVDYDKIESATVKVGLVDKIAGKNTGDIYIYANRLVGQSSKYGTATTNVPFHMQHVPDPYAVFELFKRVSHDIKTDISYPNAIRPQENPGYQTEYKPPQDTEAGA